MNYSEKKNILYRFISVGILLVSLLVDAFALYNAFTLGAKDKYLTISGLFICAAFTILEFVVILKGWKKDSNLYKIAFNESDHVNNVPLIAVIVGTVFGIGLMILSVVIYCTKTEIDTKNAMSIIMAISVYLVANCLIYYIFLLMFRKKPLSIKDLIK